jgi:hypothetical protein
MAKRPKSITDYAVPTLREARAIHAWSKGEASADDQKIAFAWIIKSACRAGQEVFAPGQGDVTAYLAGRLSVSLQIGWVLGQPLDAFRQGEVD